MKNFPCASILVLIFNLFAFTQTNNVSNCPIISVTEPASVPAPGTPMTFIARITDGDWKNIEYHWMVSGGKILSGQGTSTINVSTEKWMETNITATVEVKGLPKECQNNKASGTGAFSIHWTAFQVDEYGAIPFNKIKSKLKNIDLEPVETGIFTFYFRVETTDEKNLKKAKSQASRIKKFLIENLGTPKDKIFFDFKHSNVNFTKVFMMPIGQAESFENQF